MVEQKVLITSSENQINDLIDDGWVVKNVVAQHVSISTSSSYSQQIKGDFLIVLERGNP
jgi:hypothetical protein